MYYRFDRELKGKELSAHTLATFMVLQGLAKPLDIRSDSGMPSQMLNGLLRTTALSYWKGKGWLTQEGEVTRLSTAGRDKGRNRLGGKDGAFSVSTEQVLQMGDIIRRGSASPYAAGEALEQIGDATDPKPEPKPAAAPVEAPNKKPEGKAQSPRVVPAPAVRNVVPKAREAGKVTAPVSAAPRMPSPSPGHVGQQTRKTPGSLYRQLEDLGRVRLSKTFYLRDFLYSEIAYAEGIPNLPEDPDLAIEAGKQLCERVLEPLQEGLGRLEIRSAFRCAAINAKGAENGNQYSCAGNARNRAAHIWDQRDEQGRMGATACIVVPSFQAHYEKTGDWTPLSWWIYDHVPEFHSLFFFSRLAAFNIRWLERAPARESIKTCVKNPHTGDKSALVLSGIPTLDAAGRSRSWRAAFD